MPPKYCPTSKITPATPATGSHSQALTQFNISETFLTNLWQKKNNLKFLTNLTQINH